MKLSKPEQSAILKCLFPPSLVPSSAPLSELLNQRRSAFVVVGAEDEDSKESTLDSVVGRQLVLVEGNETPISIHDAVVKYDQDVIATEYVPPFNKASRPFRLRWTPKVAAFEELINGTWEPASPQLESLLVKDKNLNVDDLRAMVTAPNVVIDFILGPKRGPVPVGISISE